MIIAQTRCYYDAFIAAMKARAIRFTDARVYANATIIDARALSRDTGESSMSSSLSISPVLITQRGKSPGSTFRTASLLGHVARDLRPRHSRATTFGAARLSRHRLYIEPERHFLYLKNRISEIRCRASRDLCCCALPLSLPPDAIASLAKHTQRLESHQSAGPRQ